MITLINLAKTLALHIFIKNTTYFKIYFTKQTKYKLIKKVSAKPPPPPTSSSSNQQQHHHQASSSSSPSGLKPLKSDERMLIERDGIYRLVTAEEATAEEMRRLRMEEFKRNGGSRGGSGGRKTTPTTGLVSRPRIPHPPPTRPKSSTVSGSASQTRPSLRQAYMNSLNGGNSQNKQLSSSATISGTAAGANTSYVSNSTNLSGHMRSETTTTVGNSTLNRDGSLTSHSTLNTRTARSADYMLRKDKRQKRQIINNDPNDRGVA